MLAATGEEKRVLVIDDNIDIHLDYAKILNENQPSDDLDVVDDFLGASSAPDSNAIGQVNLQFASQGQQGLQEVVKANAEGRPYSVAFVDMRMPPGWDGLKTTVELWKADPDLQVVICTAYSDNTWQDIIDRVGTSDQLLILKKPFDKIEVSQLVVALTEKWKLTKQVNLRQKDLEQIIEDRTRKLKHAALHDPLTGLGNRKLFEQKLNETVSQQAAGLQAEVILIDLDHFKSVNDTLGHPAGDELLIAVSKRLTGCVRNADTVARLGGDEFAIIRTGKTKSTGGIERIQQALNQPYQVARRSIDCKASLGIAVTSGDRGDSEELFRKADLALYRAKENGRGCYCFYDDHMGAEASEAREIETDLGQAVKRNEFELHYQPLVDAETGEICVFEALVRWRHPERGLLNPDKFIAAAESTGLITPIGDQILRQACEEAVSWPEKIRLAVNISPVQLRDSRSLVQTIVRVLAETGLRADRLELEITESVLLQDNEEVLESLLLLREMGMRVVLDDFGVGYSSLSYLQSFPFDKLKLDRSFAMASSSSEDARLIIRAVAALGKSLGLETTAEGVETEKQLQIVLAEGFSQIQGFLYGVPRPAGELASMLNSQAARSAVALQQSEGPHAIP